MSDLRLESFVVARSEAGCRSFPTHLSDVVRAPVSIPSCN